MENNNIFKKIKNSPIINMAPLIDMVFLLLIFFMVTTNLTQQTGIEIKKPKAVNSKLLPRKNIIISVGKDEEIYIEENKITMESISDKVQELLLKEPDSIVIIMADIETKMGLAVDIMDECKKTGIQRLAIATSYEKWD